MMIRKAISAAHKIKRGRLPKNPRPALAYMSEAYLVEKCLDILTHDFGLLHHHKVPGSGDSVRLIVHQSGADGAFGGLWCRGGINGQRGNRERQFPLSHPFGDAPPLFVVGPTGEAELVNYRVRGRFYVVDRIFDVAELRLGTKKQQVVRIERVGDGTPSRKGKRS